MASHKYFLLLSSKVFFKGNIFLSLLGPSPVKYVVECFASVLKLVVGVNSHTYRENVNYLNMLYIESYCLEEYIVQS